MTDRKFLNYTRKGSGTPLVMQHGYFGSSELWQAQIDYFADYFDVIAPDLAGFGQSAELQAPDSIPASAQSLFDLLDSLAIDRFLLMGHSMGGMNVHDFLHDSA
jgi:pimeloyl-ACP methyl ester carboxylesterase